jgi:hypothetical protein
MHSWVIDEFVMGNVYLLLGFIFLLIPTPPRLGVTKEIMSRGPQVEDMECRESDA